jgi:hypothetical protein
MNSIKKMKELNTSIRMRTTGSVEACINKMNVCDGDGFCVAQEFVKIFAWEGCRSAESTPKALHALEAARCEDMYVMHA